MWWIITAVVTGILTSLAAAYIKPKVDDGFSYASSWWRNRSVARKAAHEAVVERLCNDPHEQIMLAFSIINSRMRANFNAVVSIGIYFGTYAFQARVYQFQLQLQLLWLFVGLAAGMIAAGFSFAAIQQHASAIYKNDLLNEVRSRNPDATCSTLKMTHYSKSS